MRVTPSLLTGLGAAATFAVSAQAAGLPTYGMDPNAKFKAADIPGLIIQNCRSFENWAREGFALPDHNPASIGSGVDLDAVGGGRYRCYVPVNGPLEIKKLER